MPAIALFEDTASANFHPLTYTRPVYDLICGMTSLREKLLTAYGSPPHSLCCRPVLADVVRSLNPEVQVNALPSDDILFLNGRLLPDENLAERIPLSGGDAFYVRGDELVARHRRSGIPRAPFPDIRRTVHRDRDRAGSRHILPGHDCIRINNVLLRCTRHATV